MNLNTSENVTTATQQHSQLRSNILDALATFANQRPGIDPANYGGGIDGWRAYKAESRSITRDLHDFRTLLSAVRWRESITAERLQAAFRAFSGRLTCRVDDTVAIGCTGRRVFLDYCTGQYFPTEFRKAACAVLASALWDWMRDECMPATNGWRVDGPSKWVGSCFVHEYGGLFFKKYEADEECARRGAGWYPQEMIDGLTPGEWLRRSFRREFGARLAKRWFS